MFFIHPLRSISQIYRIENLNLCNLWMKQFSINKRKKK